MKNYGEKYSEKNELPSLYLIDCLLQNRPRKLVIGIDHPEGIKRDIVVNEINFSDLLIVVGSVISVLNNYFFNSIGLYIDGMVYPANEVIELFLECDKEKLKKFTLNLPAYLKSFDKDKLEEIKTLNDLSEMRRRSDQRFLDNSDWDSEENIKSLSSILKRSMYFQPQLDFWDENCRIIFEKQKTVVSGIQLDQGINNKTKMFHHVLDIFKTIYNCDDCANKRRKSALRIDTPDFKNYIKPFLAFILLCLTNSYRRAKVEFGNFPNFLEIQFVFDSFQTDYNSYYIEGVSFSKFMNGLINIDLNLKELDQFGLHFSKAKNEVDKIVKLQCEFRFDCDTECKMKRNNVSK